MISYHILNTSCKNQLVVNFFRVKPNAPGLMVSGDLEEGGDGSLADDCHDRDLGHV